MQLEHSIEAEVSLEFAWKYRTDIATWNDPPATFILEGPFIAGSRGTTLLPGQQPLHWNIREVQPLKAFILEMQLDRAILAFEWRFDALSRQRTKIRRESSCPAIMRRHIRSRLRQVSARVSQTA